MESVAVASITEGSPDAIEWHCFDYDITFENYSVLRVLEPGQCAVSEEFVGGKYNWELHYFPNGSIDENNEGHSSVFLKRSNNVTWFNPVIKTRFHITMHHNSFGYDVNTVIVCPLDPSVHTFCNKNPIWGFNRFISKSIVEKYCWDKSKDCIKLRCYIWVTKEFSSGVKRRVRKREGSEDSQ
ncbi:BTB/POZ and MATH domain-containing protein 3 [Carex littledalei]|uniref:BTB/POZ and MATH domain-containing protein 3 n=1 Tax=Carex littledalei TaxID=544730 RepID=A0A833RNK5_9POAL|nr:BTB/POZ and MATH domain-containing protein 3 [Carex littledalei]